MVLETCLWVTTLQYMFGISLRKLMGMGKKEVEDWESIPSFPFDFRLRLPEWKMQPFVFDSKLFLAGGLVDTDDDSEPARPSSKFYQLNAEAENKILWEIADSIPSPPTLVSLSYIANIAGEIYLLVFNRITVPRDQGLWVLRSGRWQPLPPPPFLYQHGFSFYCKCFVHRDKLFVEIEDCKNVQLRLYVFDSNPGPDTQNCTWTEVKDYVKNSFALFDSDEFCFPAITLSYDFCGHSVALTCSILETAPGDHQAKVKIHALLMDKNDNSVRRYQSLDECSNAIQPSTFDFATFDVNFCELGNGKVCALLYGCVPEHDNALSPVICVLVFSLALAEPSTESERFLSVVDVLVNRVFTMKEYPDEYMVKAIIFPPEN